MRVLVLALMAMWVAAFGASAQAPPPGAGMIGIEMRDITKAEADKLGFEAPTGVWVVKPVAGAPTEKAGLLVNGQYSMHMIPIRNPNSTWRFPDQP